MNTLTSETDAPEERETLTADGGDCLLIFVIALVCFVWLFKTHCPPGNLPRG